MAATPDTRASTERRAKGRGPFITINVIGEVLTQSLGAEVSKVGVRCYGPAPPQLPRLCRASLKPDDESPFGTHTWLGLVG